ncbi:MAG: hypothetical protein WBQ79_19225 [Acidobacteriaceae bacterium]
MDAHAGSYGEEPGSCATGNTTGNLSQRHRAWLCVEQPACRIDRTLRNMQIMREDVSGPKRDNAQRNPGPGDALQNIKDSSITAADHNSVDAVLDCLLRLAACSPVCSRFQKLDFNASALKNVKDVVHVLRSAYPKQWIGE